MDRKEKTELIYKEALKVFSKYGFKKTTIEDIANSLGMTKGNLYLYAKDKRDLYEKAVAYGLRRWQNSAIRAMEQEDDVVQKLIVYATKGWEYLSKDTEMQNIVLDDPSVFPLYPEEDHFYKINVDSMNIVKDLLKKGIEEKKIRKIDVDYTAQFLYSLYIMFVIKTYVKSEGNSVDNLINVAFELLMNGLLVK